MFTNEQLKSMRDVAVTRLAELEAKITARRNELAGIETEYGQLLQFCIEEKIEQDGSYHLLKKTSARRTVIPSKFAELFPEANKILLARYLAFVNSELDKVAETKVLPTINVGDAKEVVGNSQINQACEISTSYLYHTTRREDIDIDRR
ncbi:hypothetical protein [Methanoregula sp.]|jgi:hypothetical protein|uniref:hypothetical protein n=1 Tax=Methanoregula sp. TaxID=2052170 RepID=UPI0025FE9656|nr:hypothetical protein [Methanoregula sp.]